MRSLFRPEGPAAFHDKAWRRADMAVWDVRWRRLSVAARRAILETVRTGPYQGGARPINAADSVAAAVLAELSREGFVEAHSDGFLAAEAAVGFVNRVRSLRRFALLDGKQPSQFERYVSQVFATFDLGGVIADVVEKQTGVGRYRISGDVYELFVRRHFWPEWAADALADPLARELIAAIEAAGGPVSLASLPEMLRTHPPDEVRAAYDRLVNHLVLFEDMDASTWDLLTGLLPVVRTERRKRRLRKPPALEKAAAVEVGPEGGVEVPDLRAVLLEVSAGRPRLKQDQSLYAKEKERFVSALDPLPAWMLGGDEAERRELRLAHAQRTALRLGLVQAVKGPDDATLLDLTAAGRAWLLLPREAQYATLFDDLREGMPSRQYPHALEDSGFLGSPLSVSLVGAAAPSGPWRQQRAEERQPLRDAAHGLLMHLPVGTFFSLDAFFVWASDLSRNPLLLGRSLRDVTVVREDDRIVPPLEDHLAEACRSLLRGLFTYRLIGLGCVRMGRDAAGQLVFARQPRLDAYFGLEVAEEEAAPAGRVVVQPDFSVIVIGPDAAPLAELAPFCDRVQGSAGAGAVTLRISRESVYRGIAGGVKAADIPARLKRHASNAVPQNVLAEVEGWCGQARAVSVGPATLIRCPDAATAARAAGVLGKQAERLGDTAVAISGPLTPALRQKLQAQGVIVEGGRRKK